MNGFDLTACLELKLLCFYPESSPWKHQGPPVLPDHPHTLKPGFKGDVCLVGEKPDKELPGIVGARGDTV